MGSTGCSGCRDEPALGFSFSMAFEPVIDVLDRRVIAYEALVRGVGGEGAASVLRHVDERNRYAFDQAARVAAIEWAQKLGMSCTLSINFMPNAVYNPTACIQRTLEAARRVGWPTDRIVFEVSESERVVDRSHLLRIFETYQAMGFKTAIDDFGAGHAGLGLLADFQPDWLKIDMELIRNVERRPTARSIVNAIVRLSEEIGCVAIAEGVETRAEYECLVDLGIRLMQGFHFCKTGFESLPQWPDPTPA
jgi:EAL domain-containing protein (putative c-di-GMP-specific phosphodiesterase class I)